MLIIFGKKISDEKQVRYALPEIYGIGFSIANKICNLLDIPLNVKISDLTEHQKFLISTYIKENYLIDNQLKIQLQNNIQTTIDIKAFVDLDIVQNYLYVVNEHILMVVRVKEAFN